MVVRPAAGRHDALAVVGEEDRVDQLRFTAREFGDEGHRQAVVAQPRQRAFDALFGGAVQQGIAAGPPRYCSSAWATRRARRRIVEVLHACARGSGPYRWQVAQ
jgi:hypothetical protein